MKTSNVKDFQRIVPENPMMEVLKDKKGIYYLNYTETDAAMRISKADFEKATKYNPNDTFDGDFDGHLLESVDDKELLNIWNWLAKRDGESAVIRLPEDRNEHL